MEEATSREIVGFILLALETYPKNAFPAKENLAFLRFFFEFETLFISIFSDYDQFSPVTPRNAP